MFVKVSGSGARCYAQLIEPFRSAVGTPRQRTVCTLGRLEAGSEVDTLIAPLRRAQGQPRRRRASGQPARQAALHRQLQRG